MPHCHTTEDVIFEIIVEITKTISNEGFLGTYVICTTNWSIQFESYLNKVLRKTTRTNKAFWTFQNCAVHVEHCWMKPY